MRVIGGPMRQMGVLKQVGCERYVACNRSFIALLTRQLDEIEAEQLVDMGKIVRGQQNGCIFTGTFQQR